MEEIVSAINAQIVHIGNCKEFGSICTDSRKVKKGDVFIALKGPNFNGNKFIKEASSSGASLCIVDEYIPSAFDNMETGVIKVADTNKALLDLAGYYRKKLRTKIIGITGSTGKTSTKDLTAAALNSKYRVFKTKGNFNNEIGLPLMIFSLDNTYDIAVLEMGMSNLGEIHRMAEAARPDCALITNIGIAHIENLKTKENILKAKLEITDFFNEENVLIVNADSEFLRDLKTSGYKTIKTGIEYGSDYSAYDIELYEENVNFRVLENGVKHPEKFHIDMPGKHTINNALLAVACARFFGLTINEIAEGFKNIEKTSMRLDVIRGGKYTILNDCYNANPDSMKSGLEVLKNFKGGKKVAILGTMGELGDNAWNEHKLIGAYASDAGVDFLIALGEFCNAYKEGYGDNCYVFEDYDEAVKFAISILESGDAVIVKASRFMKFEEIVDKLKQADYLEGGDGSDNE